MFYSYVELLDEYSESDDDDLEYEKINTDPFRIDVAAPDACSG